MRIIAGPCQHENMKISFAIARECKEVCDKYNIEYIFKASYDKANRSSIGGVRGRGMEETLIAFRDLKEKLGVKTLTDVHSVEEIRQMEDYNMELVDVLQIPAFLCRQTDLVKAAHDTGKIINIKKGQFLAPWDVQGILTKVDDHDRVWITERGTMFGYNTLVVDFTGMDWMLNNLPCELVFDATHAVQKPGGNGMSSGGNREYVPGLLRAAAALGVQNFFMEVHPDPDDSPSDGPNMLNLDDFEEVVYDITVHSR
jgi:2-dehydro-3-deoxyphosphooctonate aldolase (KDO 8-P synthase)